MPNELTTPSPGGSSFNLPAAESTRVVMPDLAADGD
jgi:hypothetical protein